MAVAQVQRISHLECGGGGGGVLQQAELGGGELRHVGGTGAAVGAEPVPTPPTRGGDGAVEVGPVNGEQHEPSLVLDHRGMAGRDQVCGLGGVHRRRGIEHVIDTTEGH